MAKVAWGVGGVLAAVVVLGWISIRPSNDRDWAPDQSRLATAAWNGDALTVDNVRSFDHCPEDGSLKQRWERRTLDLRALDSVWLVLSPFERDWRGPAHPFLSFGFADSAFIAVSVEARRDGDEDFSIWKGMLKRYEIAYVVADERDVITLRVLCRDDDVYVYPLKVSPERARTLFREMLDQANDLAERPAFYHTVFRNCANTVLRHANAVALDRIPDGWKVLLPGYSDEIVHSLGLVDADGSLEEVRARFLVNDAVREHAGSPEFSAAIRRPGRE
jgi:hypothetical protein